MFDEIHPRPDRHSRPGEEGRTAVKTSRRLKALLALAGAVLCLFLAGWAWWWGLPWLAIFLGVLVVWALADVGWQLYRLRRPRTPKRL